MKRHAIPKRELKRKVHEEGIHRRTLSFYRYIRIKNPQAMRDELFTELTARGCFGRVYIASEGINAQMNVPIGNWQKFNEYIQGKIEFKGVPYKVAIEERDTVSFYRLTVKVKSKIVADGLGDDSFDVTKTGEYLTAEEMNAYVDDPEATVVDMRNGYESEIGHFEGAITPDVDTFREELKAITGILKAQKNKKIALYCTGGIRCEKASAWLVYNGFTNVKHLKGGIIDYKRQVDEKGLSNKFKGKNFVFDERMGERISDDIIAHCHLCTKEQCDEHVHCKNQACHVLFICCGKCKIRKRGYCSYGCMLFDKFPEKVKKILIRNNHKKKLEQFKKHRLKSLKHLSAHQGSNLGPSR